MNAVGASASARSRTERSSLQSEGVTRSRRTFSHPVPAGWPGSFRAPIHHAPVFGHVSPDPASLTAAAEEAQSFSIQTLPRRPLPLPSLTPHTWHLALRDDLNDNNSIYGHN
jgi:hypothetical protein